MAQLPPLRQGKPGLTARLRQLAHGPDYDAGKPGSCAHNYIFFHDEKTGKAYQVCIKCGHTIR